MKFPVVYGDFVVWRVDVFFQRWIDNDFAVAQQREIAIFADASGVVGNQNIAVVGCAQMLPRACHRRNSRRNARIAAATTGG